MKITPILFTDRMIRALLDGTKTQTRRPMDSRFIGPAVIGFEWQGGAIWQQILSTVAGRGAIFSCRYGGPQDLLYARESCRAKELNEQEAHALNQPPNIDGVYYMADRTFIPCQDNKAAAELWLDLDHYGVKRGHSNRRGRVVPNIHMPRWASRLTLQITETRTQRLADITEADARAEGVEGIDQYLALWDAIHGAGAAAINPHVYALTFKVHSMQVDDYLLAMPA